MRKLVDKLNTQKGVQVDYRCSRAPTTCSPSTPRRVAEAVEDYCGKAIARRNMALAAD